MRSGLILIMLLLSGCAAVIDRATGQFAEDLEAAILGYDTPKVIDAGLPAYLLLLEARLQNDPDSVALRLSTARLTSTYASLFATDPAAQQSLNQRALNHARHAACTAEAELCGLGRVDFASFEELVKRLDPADLDLVYALATVWTAWIDAHSSDYRALADLPRVESLLAWVVEIDPVHDDGAPWLYLAVLNSQRPPAAGGQPDKARTYFDLAREHSSGKNLLINVMMADSYARLLFDRELYVRLLEQVLASEVEDPQYTLVNQIARARARELLQQTVEIFD